MVNMRHIVTNWTGGKIGTGFSNHYFTVDIGTAQQAYAAVRTFFSDAYGNGSYLPGGVSIAVSGTVDTIDPSNGHLVDSTAVTTSAPVTGLDVGNYPALAGACVTWRTPDFSVKGHRIRGRTFLVPAGPTGFQNDGSLGSGFLSGINGAATALVAALPELLVWRRPSSPGATDGSSHAVTSGLCQDKAAFLTSRR